MLNGLSALQKAFQAYLLDVDDSNLFQVNVVGTEKVPIETRLSIYHHAYRSRLLETLGSNYPMLKKYMGEELFEKLGSDYISRYPSRYRSIRWFGDHFADFLRHHTTISDYPYLAEFAQFEWHMTLVFDAADGPHLALCAMSEVPTNAWADMRLILHPSIHRLQLSWNVISIWQALMNEQTPEEPKKNNLPIEWLLWRHQLTSYFASLNEIEKGAIDAAMNGLTFGEICEQLCQWVSEEEAGLQAASLLKGWLQSGLISEIKY